MPGEHAAAGDFDAIISWSVETWGGHPDLSFFLDSWHSQFIADAGKPQPPRNWQRWKWSGWAVVFARLPTSALP